MISPIPVNNSAESIASPGGTAAPSNRGRVVFCDGLYYAQLAVSDVGKVFTVALHGVRSEAEATQALEALLPLSRSTESGSDGAGVFHI
jgi:hypothetical protein